jgi:hypothetical protein
VQSARSSLRAAMLAMLRQKVIERLETSTDDRDTRDGGKRITPTRCF